MPVTHGKVTHVKQCWDEQSWNVVWKKSISGLCDLPPFKNHELNCYIVFARREDDHEYLHRKGKVVGWFDGINSATWRFSMLDVHVQVMSKSSSPQEHALKTKLGLLTAMCPPRSGWWTCSLHSENWEILIGCPEVCSFNGGTSNVSNKDGGNCGMKYAKRILFKLPILLMGLKCSRNFKRLFPPFCQKKKTHLMINLNGFGYSLENNLVSVYTYIFGSGYFLSDILGPRHVNSKFLACPMVPGWVRWKLEFCSGETGEAFHVSVNQLPHEI